MMQESGATLSQLYMGFYPVLVFLPRLHECARLQGCEHPPLHPSVQCMTCPVAGKGTRDLAVTCHAAKPYLSTYL